MNFIDLGLITYDKALTLQLDAVRHVMHGGNERVFLLEHYPVITLGRNHSKSNVLVNEKYLKSMDIQLVNSSRGGDVTCHFPGQLVVYPVMRMEKRPGGIKHFFRNLEQVIINLLHDYGIIARPSAGQAGVFTSCGKIASMGIAVKKWVTYHGIALNLHRDMTLFQVINPCGLRGVNMTSVHRVLNSDHPDMKRLKMDFCIKFRELFGR